LLSYGGENGPRKVGDVEAAPVAAQTPPVVVQIGMLRCGGSMGLASLGNGGSGWTTRARGSYYL
jgi:hypothetical protein